MPPVTVFETPNVTLWYHPQTGIVHHEIRRFISGNEFRDLLTSGSDVLRKNSARKWLSDDRGQWVLRKDDIAWSESMWAPNAVKAGWKYWAVVRADKVLAQVAMDELAARYAALGVQAQFFTDPRNAMGWLEKQV